MEVINNSKDIRKALKKNIPEIVGCVGFSPKNPTTNVHHEGHSYLLAEAKNQCDILVATYSQPNSLVNCLRDSELPLNYVLDLSYCTTFCQNNNVDILYIIDDQEVKQNIDKNEEKEKTKNSTKTVKDHVSELNTWMDDILKGAVVFHKHNLNDWKKDKIFASWSDGYLRFAQKEVYSVEGLPEVILVNPLRRPDGLPYSSTILQFSQEDINILLKAKQAFEDFLVHQNQRVLEKALKNVDDRTIPNLQLSEQSKIQDGILGLNNLLLQVSYTNLTNSLIYSLNEFYVNPWNQ